MKRTRVLGMVMVLAALTTNAFAARTAASEVERIAAHDTSFGGKNWFSLVSVTSAGTCPKFGNAGNKVIFTFDDDARGQEQASLLKAALLSGKKVQVTYTETLLAGGFCKAQAIELLR